MRYSMIASACLLAMAITGHAAMTFVHPGAVESKEELLFVKAQIAAGAQPWTGQYQNMQQQYVVPGSGQTPTDEGDQRTQAQRAYANALAYWYTGNELYAKQAIAIIKQWANFTPYDIPVVTNGSTSCTQSMLDASWMGDLLGPTAELLRGYMSSADLLAVQNIFKKVFIPSLSVRDPSNSNRDLAGIKAVLSIAVFMEDTTFFNFGIQRFKERMPSAVYLKTDGPNPPNIAGATWAEYSPNFASPNANGLTQETCRDFNHHAHFIIAGMTNAAEIAWHQGVDLYGQYQERMTDALELISKELVSGDMQGVCLNGNTSITTDLNTFDIGYNHFHNRMGISMPNTLALLPQSRTQGSWWVSFYETLTHANLPAPTSSSSSNAVLISSSAKTVSSSSKATVALLQSTFLESNGPMTVQIYNTLGKLVREAAISDPLSLGSLYAGLPKDVYIVRKSVRGEAVSSNVMKLQ